MLSCISNTPRQSLCEIKSRWSLLNCIPGVGYFFEVQSFNKLMNSIDQTIVASRKITKFRQAIGNTLLGAVGDISLGTTFVVLEILGLNKPYYTSATSYVGIAFTAGLLALRTYTLWNLYKDIQKLKPCSHKF